MFCPHCGVENLKETKFCRGCGEDLRLVSQAVTKSLPLVIAHRVDEAIDRGRGGWQSYQLFRKEHRKAYSQILMSLSALFIVVWTLMLGHGNISFAGGFLLVMTLSILFSSIHEILVRKNHPNQNELPSSVTTRELPPPKEPAAASVTERTTRELKIEREARREGQ